MDPVRLGYDLVRAYVYALVLAAVGTVLWVVTPDVAASPQVASVWFAVAGFGMLVLVTFVLIQYARRTT